MALRSASAALRGGGFIAFIRSTLVEKFNTPYQVFVGTFLCASRPRPRSVDSGAAGGASADGSDATELPVVSFLWKLNSHGPHHAANFKRAIAGYAGVQMGPEVASIMAVARSLGVA